MVGYKGVVLNHVEKEHSSCTCDVYTGWAGRISHTRMVKTITHALDLVLTQTISLPECVMVALGLR